MLHLLHMLYLLHLHAACPQVCDFKDFWSAGQAAGYEVLVAEPAESDPEVIDEQWRRPARGGGEGGGLGPGLVQGGLECTV